MKEWWVLRSLVLLCPNSGHVWGTKKYVSWTQKTLFWIVQVPKNTNTPQKGPRVEYQAERYLSVEALCSEVAFRIPGRWAVWQLENAVHDYKL